jgi:hypothetical protein
MTKATTVISLTPTNDTTPTRDLIVVSSDTYIHIYTYENDHQQGSSQMLPFGDELFPSIFYVAPPNYVITATAVLGEQFQRYNQPGNIGLTGQLAWLLVGTYVTLLLHFCL